jgi:hypothetical protein
MQPKQCSPSESPAGVDLATFGRFLRIPERLFLFTVSMACPKERLHWGLGNLDPFWDSEVAGWSLLVSSFCSASRSSWEVMHFPFVISDSSIVNCVPQYPPSSRISSLHKWSFLQGPDEFTLLRFPSVHSPFLSAPVPNTNMNWFSYFSIYIV